MTIKTMRAENVKRREGVGFAGTESHPRPIVHSTFYKREDGSVLVAMVKGGTVELRPSEKVRVSYDHEADQWANLRMCRQCPVEHPRYVSAGKTGACYCREAVNASAAAYRVASRSGKSAAERQAERLERLRVEREEAVASRTDALVAATPKSRDHLINVQLSNIARLSGPDSVRFKVVATQYQLTVEEAHERIAAVIADLRAEQTVAAS